MSKQAATTITVTFRHFCLMLMCLPFLLYHTSSFANDNFDFQQSSKQLDQYAEIFIANKYNLQELQTIIASIRNLRNESRHCAALADTKLTDLDNLQKNIHKSPNVNTKSVAYQFLQKRINTVIQVRAECHIFTLRANEMIKQYNTITIKLFKRELFQAGPRLANHLHSIPQKISDLVYNFNFKTFYRTSGLHALQWWIWLLLAFILTFAVWIAMGWQTRISTILANVDDSTEEQNIPLLSLLSAIKRHGISLTIVSVVTLYLILVSIAHQTFYPLTLFAFFVFIAECSLIVAQVIIFPSKAIKGLRIIPPYIATHLYNRVKTLIILLLLAACTQIITENQNIPLSAYLLLRTLFMTLLAINTIAIVWLLNSVLKTNEKYKNLRLSLQFVLAILLLSTIGGEWLGYHNLTNYILYGVLTTMLSSILVWFVHHALITMLNTVEETNHSWQIKFRHMIGIKKNSSIPELILLRLVIHFVMTGILLLILCKTWEVDYPLASQLLLYINEGFPIAGFVAYPLNIMLSLVILTVFILITRVIRTRLAIRDKRYYEHGSKNALASIAGYIGFSISFIIALLIAGINLSGIALIAGALSVGIGFSLQTIVANFLSGIILLLEQPIKIGDLITVNNIEGYVKSISLRYTVVRTLDHTDLIVPNSELIGKQVNNLMCHDHHNRVNIQVGVAYGTDTDLTKRLLLEVAEAHPEVIDKYISDVPNEIYTQPMAIFNEFGTSTYVFNLHCMIKDVNRRPFIVSDLHQAVEKIFADHNIIIAFPQRDIHVKNAGDIFKAV